jgi:hypothetical protein
VLEAARIGFAVADGRPAVIAVESGIAGVFVVVAAAGVTGPAWLLVLGLTGHGFKDLWQERRHYVANTRWWPPFCLVIDWLVAAILIVLIAAGVDFHHQRRIKRLPARTSCMAAINRDHLEGAEALPPARDASALPTGVLNADLVCVVQLQLLRRRLPIGCSGWSVSSGQVRFGGVSG